MLFISQQKNNNQTTKYKQYMKISIAADFSHKFNLLIHFLLANRLFFILKNKCLYLSPPKHQDCSGLNFMEII